MKERRNPRGYTVLSEGLGETCLIGAGGLLAVSTGFTSRTGLTTETGLVTGFSGCVVWVVIEETGFVSTVFAGSTAVSLIDVLSSESCGGEGHNG